MDFIIKINCFQNDEISPDIVTPSHFVWVNAHAALNLGSASLLIYVDEQVIPPSFCIRLLFSNQKTAGPIRIPAASCVLFCCADVVGKPV